MGTDVQFATVQELLDYFNNHKEIDFDTETEGFDPYTCKVLSAQFGDSENQYVVDCLTVPLELFKGLLENPEICWNMQNAKFDLRFLYHHRIVPHLVYDTFLAEKVLTLGILNSRRALDHLVWKYCKQTMDKTVRGNIHREGLSKRVILYGAKDVAYLGEIKRKQMVKIKEAELEKALQLENLFVKVLAYIEYSGFYLDKDAWKSKMEKDLSRLNEAREALDTWVIDNGPTKYIDTQLDLFFSGHKCAISWSSPKQVIPLFKDLGIETKVKDKKTGNFKDSVEASVIKSQKDKSSIVALYLKYKALEKIVTTYGNSFLKSINKESGRIHTQFNQLMNTGRLSCGGKNHATKEEYLNFQNIPASPENREEGRIYERDCFTPEKGRHFIVSDYSGQEAVVLVNQSLDKDLLAFYDKKMGDMHKQNCACKIG